MASAATAAYAGKVYADATTVAQREQAVAVGAVAGTAAFLGILLTACGEG